MKTKLVVFFAVDSTMYGGAARSLLSVLQSASPYKKLVICPEDGEFVDACRKFNIPVAIIQKFPPLKVYKFPQVIAIVIKFFYRFIFFVRVFLFLIKTKPDLVVANTFLNSGSILAASSLRIPVITHFRDYRWRLSELHPIRREIVFHLTNKFIAISYAVRDLLIEYGIDPSKIVVVYNGISSDIWLRNDTKPIDLKDKWEATTEKVIGVVGSIEPRKELIVVVEAIKLLVEQDVSVCLFVVGDVPEKMNTDYLEQVKALVKKYNLQKVVTFVGFQADIVPWMKAFDIVLVPSQEAFGRTVVEAMLAQKPVITPNVGGQAELVMDGQTGLLIEPGSAQALANAIRRLIENPVVANSMGEKGKERAIREFSTKKYVNGINQFLLDLLSD